MLAQAKEVCCGASVLALSGSAFAAMGATRALATVRDGSGKMLWVNDRSLADSLIAARGASQGASLYEGFADEVSQRAKVVEAGLATAQLLTGDATTPLASAVRALRQLNAAANAAKHAQRPQAFSWYGTRPMLARPPVRTRRSMTSRPRP